MTDKFDPQLPARLRAEAGLVRTEVKLYRAVIEALEEWLPRVEAAVVDDQAPEPIVAAPNPDRWEQQLREDWEALVDRKVLPVIEAMFDRRFAEVAGKSVSPDPYRSAYIKERRENLLSNRGGVADTAFEHIREVIDLGTKAGATPDQLEKLVRQALDVNDVEEFYKGRARTIARTEAVGTYNSAALSAGQALQAAAPDTALLKGWLSTVPSDGRTRSSHIAADGQVVGIHEFFSVGGAQLANPGDGNGPADETINCRCSLAIGTAEELLLAGFPLDREAEAERARKREAEQASLLAASRWAAFRAGGINALVKHDLLPDAKEQRAHRAKRLLARVKGARP